MRPFRRAQKRGQFSDEIVVTAQKREQAIQDVPGAVAALGAEALEQRGVRDVEALQFLTPSLQAGASVGVTQISIRGVGMNLTAATTQPGVGVYVDGIYQTRTSVGGLDQLDLARVEVLRGPQGTLYGRNATGGAVNFISYAPTDHFEGYLLGAFAEYETYRLQGVVNAPLSDRVRARFAIDYRDQSDGFVKNVIPGNPDVDASDAVTARLGIAADVSENVSLDLALFGGSGEGPVDYLVLRSAPSADAITLNPVLAGAIVPSEDHRTSANGESASERGTWGATGTLNWDLGALSFKSITGYSHDEYTNAYDADGTNADFIASTNESRSDTFSQEFNLSGESGGIEWLTGLYYLHDELELHQRFAFPSGFSGLSSGSFLTIDADPYETTAYAVYADGAARITGNLNLLAGARYSREEQSVSQGSALGLQMGSVEIPLVTFCDALQTDLEFESFDARGGLQYEFDDRRNVYVTISRGFKAGGVNESSCLDNLYAPEEITAYEAGFRSRLFDDRLTLNATIFHYDYSDFQVQQILGLQAAIVDAPSATVDGLELETVLAPNEHWGINATLSLLNSEYGAGFFNTDVLDRAAGVQNLAGNELNRSPAASGNLGLQYRTGERSFGEIIARADLYLTGRSYFREFNAPEDSQAGYELLNLNLIWNAPEGGFSARLFANNLTDAEYVATLGANENVGSRFFTWGAPRQVGIEVKKRF